MISLTDQTSLPSTDLAPGMARDWVRQRLDAWSLTHLSDDCLLVTSELVTNAVRHGRPPVALDVALLARRLQVRVHDGSSRPPRIVDADLQSESGRGMALALHLSDGLSVEQVSDDGKRVVAVWHEPWSQSGA